MISTWLAILIAVLTLIIGLVGGFFLARNSMKSYLAKNPPISEEMMKSMMMSMGQKPSQKLSLIHISEPTRRLMASRMPSSA